MALTRCRSSPELPQPNNQLRTASERLRKTNNSLTQKSRSRARLKLRAHRSIAFGCQESCYLICTVNVGTWKTQISPSWPSPPVSSPLGGLSEHPCVSPRSASRRLARRLPVLVRVQISNLISPVGSLKRRMGCPLESCA